MLTVAQHKVALEQTKAAAESSNGAGILLVGQVVLMHL
jgi:hypothetical protein